MPLFSLVVPAYNEGRRIGKLLDSLVSSGFLQKNAEVIFVVDGDDNTAEIIRKKTAKGKLGAKIVESGERLGKGGAVWKGFSEAKGEFVGFLDADGPVSMEELEAMVKRSMESGACIIASREWGKREGLRKHLSIAFNLIVRILFGRKERDTQCGCKVLPKKLLGDKPFLVKGFAFDVELLERVNRNGGRVEEFPIEAGDRGGGGFSLLDAPGMMLDLLRLKFAGRAGGCK